MQLMEKTAQAAREADQCVLCGGQLAVLSGTLLRGLNPGEIFTRDEFGHPPEKDLERDLTGQVTDRARRQVFIGCGTCRTPVPYDHPRQLTLDRDWASEDARQEAERERAAKAPRARVTPYKELNPLLDAEDRLDRLEKDRGQILQALTQLREALGQVQQQLAALQTKRKGT